MYEPNQHDDAVTPDNIVRSQFGSPRSSKNGGQGRRNNSADVPETYRFDPHRPRRRRYATDEHQEPDTAELPDPAANQQPSQAPETDAAETDDAATPTSGWTVARPTHLANGSRQAEQGDVDRRRSRAERRRAAEHAPGASESAGPTGPAAPPTPPAPENPGAMPERGARTGPPAEQSPAIQPLIPPGVGQNPAGRGGDVPGEHPEQYATTRKSDLTRIASFLRSTQDADSNQATPSDGIGEKTSELPTVPPGPATPPASKELVTTDQADPTESVLNAVRQIPGVISARLTDSDQKLALDIAEEADSELVQRKVAELLDSQLGLQAQPVSAAVGSIESDSGERLSPVSRAVLERIQVITSGFESTVEVALAVDGARAVGRSSGPAVDWHILRGAADATVDAVGVLVGKDARVVVEHASIETAGSVKVALVVVLLLTETGAEQLAGAAPVTGDRRQAVVHATLSALNRRIEAMLA